MSIIRRESSSDSVRSLPRVRKQRTSQLAFFCEHEVVGTLLLKTHTYFRNLGVEEPLLYPEDGGIKYLFEKQIYTTQHIVISQHTAIFSNGHIT
jgi:hypothetical protein